MPHESDPSAEPIPQGKFKIVEPKEGAVRAYANFSHLSWNGMDLTVQLYQLEQPNRDIPEYKDHPNCLRHTASVTLTWAAAKTFYEILGQALDRYEKVYGSINTQFTGI
jgi:hypothetical protein